MFYSDSYFKVMRMNAHLFLQTSDKHFSIQKYPSHPPLSLSLSLCRRVLVKAFVFIQVATCNFNPSPPNFKSLLGLPFSFYLCLFFCQFISPFYLPLRLSDVVLCQWNKWFLSDISFHPKNFF